MRRTGDHHDHATQAQDRLRPLDGDRDDGDHLVRLITLNLGFAEGFARTWLRSWGISYVIVIPAILVIGPRLQAQIERFIH